MGGDHKCPVCQATFTRPQHVARHMRSHTGDRPYKCQYCGDQFARSDLLARHINKCHANEKPLPNIVAGGRRKGSAAASRATTSKQACDQCVQSSLPCDGSIPCSKCVSRKSRCTYIKFHRQTAPSGPGHHPPRHPSSSLTSLSGSIDPLSHPESFILVPPQPILSVGTAPLSDQVFHTPFTFDPAAPPYPPHWPPTLISQLPPSITSDEDSDAKYRGHAEFIRRAGPSTLPHNSPTILPNTFVTQPHTTNWFPVWGEHGTYLSLDDTKPFEGIVRTRSLTSSDSLSFPPEYYGVGHIGSAYRSRKMSLEFSDSSSATSHSVPSSATSSSVQLPLTANEVYEGSEEIETQTHDGHDLQHHRRSSMPATQLPPFPLPSDTSHPQRAGEGNFSSAFGLMSIDDPNVLAGLSSDGISFFSTLGVGVMPHSPNATPMPTRVQQPHPHHARERPMSLGQLPTPGSSKESADVRELKDMWRTYLRSPLSGSGTATFDLSLSPQMPQSPSGQRRRVRVSSMPSVTPTVEKGHPLAVNGHGESNGAVGGSSLRTMVHGNPDDLRSYEAAVNARSAPLKLNLVPRRKATRPSLRASPTMEETGAASSSSSSSPAILGAGTGHGDQARISRPSSSSSTSSLAQAFTIPALHHTIPHGHVPTPPRLVKPLAMQEASISLPIVPSLSMTTLHSSSYHSHPHPVGFGSSTSLTFEPSSRASSVTSDGTGTGGSGSDGEVFRPSFKRYASQTLGPSSSKRALVDRGSGESKSVKVEGMAEGRMMEGENMAGFEGAGVSAGAGSPGSRPMAALPERAKRG